MAASLTSLARWLFALAVGCALATACVRSEPPKAFICTSKDDCEEHETCRSGQCEPIDSCTIDYECYANLKVCRDRRCVSVECTYLSDENCGGYGCDVERNVCYTTCSTDDQCPYEAYCDQGSCIPGQRLLPSGQGCSLNVECESGTCCARSSGSVCADRCEPAGTACTAAQECKDKYCCAQPLGGSVCSSSPCVLTSCAEDEDCESTEYCSAAGRCMRLLVAGASCKAPRECQSGACAASVCRGEGSAGDLCDKSYECEAGRKCCAMNLYRRECHPESASCLAETGYPCDYSYQCADNRCESNGFCSKACDTSADCGVGPFGQNVCVESLGIKLCHPGCTTSTECESNYNFDFYGAICKVSSAQGYCDADL
ncbi:MAG: hypothetical protein EOO73_29575 [Myxococcales bacterium]|nr:MAG: hypothetical protein EOO73_29575 [Myxococcales bacterium]